jgi:hypothetical protein
MNRTPAGRLTWPCLIARAVVVCSLLVLAACAVNAPTSLYPDNVATLAREPAADVVAQAVTARIPVAADSVWNALLVVLNQYALIGRVGSTGTGGQTVSYSDVTTLLLDDKPVKLSLPFRVTVEADGADQTRLTVYGRWDLMDMERVAGDSEQRRADLRAGMETEALVLANRVVSQASAGAGWAWYEEGEDDE